jgi:DNA-binding Lrp family transcriptional regulator
VTAPRSPELDDVDRRLITALIADGRATYAALAPLVELSQAAVRTRVQRLLDEQIITVTGRVDPSSFGLGIFAFVLLEISGEAEKVAARIAEIDEAVFVAVTVGRFDLLVELRCRDEDQLLAALDRLRVLDGVRRLQSNTVIHYEKQDWTGIGHRDGPVADPPAAIAGQELDETDQRLLFELLADGRVTYAALAPTVGLSQAAVRDRVIDLIDSNVITIQAHPVPEAMGIDGFAGIAIKASGPIGPLIDSMVRMAETCLVVRTLGRFDVLAEIWFEDQDHLAELLETLRANPAAGSIDTIPYLRIALEQFGALKRQ